MDPNITTLNEKQNTWRESLQINVLSLVKSTAFNGHVDQNNKGQKGNSVGDMSQGYKSSTKAMSTHSRLIPLDKQLNPLVPSITSFLDLS